MIYYHYGGKYDHIGSTDEIKTFEEDNSKVDSTVVYDYIPHFKTCINVILILIGYMRMLIINFSFIKSI